MKMIKLNIRRVHSFGAGAAYKDVAERLLTEDEVDCLMKSKDTGGQISFSKEKYPYGVAVLIGEADEKDYENENMWMNYNDTYVFHGEVYQEWHRPQAKKSIQQARNVFNPLS